MEKVVYSLTDVDHFVNFFIDDDGDFDFVLESFENCGTLTEFSIARVVSNHIFTIGFSTTIAFLFLGLNAFEVFNI